jgi:hypothetical protein
MSDDDSETYRWIEQEHGGTYDSEDYAVYEYGTYPEGSVLEGRQKRSYVDGGYPDAAAAKAAHPEAFCSDSSGYVEQAASDVPPAWLDPAYAGESWDGE